MSLVPNFERSWFQKRRAAVIVQFCTQRAQGRGDSGRDGPNPTFLAAEDDPVRVWKVQEEFSGDISVCRGTELAAPTTSSTIQRVHLTSHSTSEAASCVDLHREDKSARRGLSFFATAVFGRKAATKPTFSRPGG